MDDQTDLLRQILAMLTLIAEPQIAERDGKLRSFLADVVGKSRLKMKAVSLMDGTRPQAIICKEAAIDQGGLSRLTKSLRGKGLLESDEKAPKLAISLPLGFWKEMES